MYESFFLPSFPLSPLSFLIIQPPADEEGKAISITVTIHLLSCILMADDNLWRMVCVQVERTGEVVSFIQPETGSINSRQFKNL